MAWDSSEHFQGLRQDFRDGMPWEGHFGRKEHLIYSQEMSRREYREQGGRDLANMLSDYRSGGFKSNGKCACHEVEKLIQVGDTVKIVENTKYGESRLGPSQLSYGVEQANTFSDMFFTNYIQSREYNLGDEAIVISISRGRDQPFWGQWIGIQFSNGEESMFSRRALEVVQKGEWQNDLMRLRERVCVLECMIKEMVNICKGETK